MDCSGYSLVYPAELAYDPLIPIYFYYREKIRMLQIKRMDGVLLIYVLLFYGINYL